MFASLSRRMLWAVAWIVAFCTFGQTVACAGQATTGRMLYVAVPGVRNYLEYGGHGLLVFDIDNGHKFVKRIETAGLDEAGKPINVKGVCASAATDRLYISTLRHLMCLDLNSEKILWERNFDAGCDRMSISPNGKTIFLPSLEGPLWYIVEAANGEVLDRVVLGSGAHNTVVGLDGKYAYLAGLKSPFLAVLDTGSVEVVRKAGPFSGSVRPFTVNGQQTLCFVNVNDLLGFEVGDLRSGKMLHRVEVQGYKTGTVKRHGCPSHGVGLTPNEKELWLTDAANSRMHVFDSTVMPPRQVASVEVRDQPGWITFSLDGRYAYPSTGDIIDTRTRQVVATLADEHGQAVQSEKMIEIHLESGNAVRVRDQFGLGRVTSDRE